jgi:hypothetical protein
MSHLSILLPDLENPLEREVRKLAGVLRIDKGLGQRMICG